MRVWLVLEYDVEGVLEQVQGVYGSLDQARRAVHNIESESEDVLSLEIQERQIIGELVVT